MSESRPPETIRPGWIDSLITPGGNIRPCATARFGGQRDTGGSGPVHPSAGDGRPGLPVQVLSRRWPGPVTPAPLDPAALDEAIERMAEDRGTTRAALLDALIPVIRSHVVALAAAEAGLTLAPRPTWTCPHCGAVMGPPYVTSPPTYCNRCAGRLAPPVRMSRGRRGGGHKAPALHHPARPDPQSDAEFIAFLDDLAADHGTTRAEILRQMRENAETKAAEATAILVHIDRIEGAERAP